MKLYVTFPEYKLPCIIIVINSDVYVLDIEDLKIFKVNSLEDALVKIVEQDINVLKKLINYEVNIDFNYIYEIVEIENQRKIRN